MRTPLRAVLALSAALSAAGCVAARADVAPPAPAAASLAADSAAAHAAAVGFLAAFDSLQWEPFAAALAEDVTMFFPFPGFAAREEGKTRVGGLFRSFFEDQIGDRTAAGRPLVQGLAPRDLRVQVLAPGAAVASFHLGAEENPARRSLVFRRDADGTWRVVHWHASAVPPRRQN